MKYTKALELATALRNGKYVQGIGQLRKGDKYCCLGVACDVSGKAGWVEGRGDMKGLFTTREGLTGSLPDDVMEHFGFHSAAGERRDGASFQVGNRDFLSLWKANDFGCDFSEIADAIMENYEQL